MVPWQLVRYGAASELLGLPLGTGLPLLGTLGDALLDSMRVVLGADLATLGALTAVNPVAHPLVIDRTLAAIETVSGAASAEWWRTHADMATPFEAGILQRATGITYSIGYSTAGQDDVLDACGLANATRDELARRLGELGEHVEAVTYDQTDGGHRTRFDTTTLDVDAVVAVLERSRIPKPQIEYFTSTVAVWTMSQPEITVRVAASDAGPIDQVGVQFRDVAGENMMRAWGTFRPRADFAERVGAVVGAMGIDSAERFEIRCYRTLQPRLEAIFVPSAAKFQRPIRA